MVVTSATRWSVLAGALALSIVGCGSDSADQQRITEVHEPATGAEIPANDVADADEQPESVSAAACLVGTWAADNQFPLTVMQDYGEGEVQSVTGEVLLSYRADGELSTEYRGWAITILAEGTTAQVGRDGVDSGTYTADDHTISFADTVIGSNLWVSSQGVRMEIVPEIAAYTDMPFTCSGDEASLTSPEGTFTLHRR